MRQTFTQFSLAAALMMGTALPVLAQPATTTPSVPAVVTLGPRAALAGSVAAPATPALTAPGQAIRPATPATPSGSAGTVQPPVGRPGLPPAPAAAVQPPVARPATQAPAQALNPAAPAPRPGAARHSHGGSRHAHAVTPLRPTATRAN